MKTTVRTLTRHLVVDIDNIAGIFQSQKSAKLFELVLKDNPKPYLLKTNAFRDLVAFIGKHKNGVTS